MTTNSLAASTPTSSPADTAGQIGYTIAAKALDAQRQNGANVLKLLNTALALSRPSTVAENGKGQNLDTLA